MRTPDDPARLPPPDAPVRDLVVIHGDQLNLDSPALQSLDVEKDAALLMEVADESTRTPSSKQRTVLFLAAMRAFAGELARRGVPVRYITLTDPSNTHTFAGEIARAIADLRPERLRVVRPGARRVLRDIQNAADEADLELVVHEDDHFLCSLDEFQDWRSGRKTLVLEHFYRWMRKRHDILMDAGKPVGGAWNFDKDNRKSFKRTPRTPTPFTRDPSPIVKQVIRDVAERLPNLPGSIDHFHWPITRDEALQALELFITERLPAFGDHQDAMWTGENRLNHSLLSAALNLKLLDPREVIERATARIGSVPLNSIEGFVRQILGWREFVRGIYWTEPDYERRNGLDAHGDLPASFWTADTDMRCVRECVTPVLNDGYSHHIQRLMVTGNLALTAQVHPDQVDAWYLGMFVDGVEWATIPNTRGMSQHADHGVVGTKPYASTGAYIKRMSNYCEHCRYNPAERLGDSACPFTTLYWDFLLHHEHEFKGNPRMTMMMKHIEKIPAEERTAIVRTARETRVRLQVIRENG